VTRALSAGAPHHFQNKCYIAKAGTLGPINNALKILKPYDQKNPFKRGKFFHRKRLLCAENRQSGSNFDVKTLNGWKPAQKPGSFNIEGWNHRYITPHLFDGAVMNAAFQEKILGSNGETNWQLLIQGFRHRIWNDGF